MGSQAGKPAGSGPPRRAPAPPESGVPALRLFTRREVAASFGVSPLRVTKWTAAGMPVVDRGGPGKESRYNLADVVAWRIEVEIQRRLAARASALEALPPGERVPPPAAPPPPRPRRFARSPWMGR